MFWGEAAQLERILDLKFESNILSDSALQWKHDKISSNGDFQM